MTSTPADSSATLRGMPRDGAAVLSDVREPALVLVCEPCGRRGRYNVARLMAKHGDAKLTELLDRLASCPKTRSFSVYSRCEARYDLGPASPRITSE